MPHSRLTEVANEEDGGLEVLADDGDLLHQPVRGLHHRPVPAEVPAEGVAAPAAGDAVVVAPLAGEDGGEGVLHEVLVGEAALQIAVPHH